MGKEEARYGLAYSKDVGNEMDTYLTLIQQVWEVASKPPNNEGALKNGAGPQGKAWKPGLKHFFDDFLPPGAGLPNLEEYFPENSGLQLNPTMDDDEPPKLFWNLVHSVID